MERNIKERVSQYVDENKVKEKLTQFFQEKIVNRKAMFIPITGVATFMLVGYAAADTKAPEITSDQIEVPYGEKFGLQVYLWLQICFVIIFMAHQLVAWQFIK